MKQCYSLQLNEEKMKIKKSDLQRLIENYLYEQSQVRLPTGDDGFSDPKQTYPEHIKTDNEKQRYDVMMAAKKRGMEYKSSDAGLKNLKFDLRWPQDFVIFEEEFEQHIKNWQLFKRVHPTGSFILQLFDLSAVSSYGDLAKSIEDISKPDPSIFDRCIFALNVFASLPIGMIVGLFSGRLGVKAVGGIATAIQQGEKNGLKLLQEIVKASSNYGDLIKPEVIRSIFKKPEVITLIEKSGKKVTDETIETIVENLDKFFKFVDSFGFRAFMRSFVIIRQKLSEELLIIILEWLTSEAGQEFVKTSKLTRWLFDKAPEQISDYLKSAFPD